MWFSMLVLLPLLVCSVSDACPHSISMSLNGFVNVTVGQSFTLTCHFSCLTPAHRVQLLKDQLLLNELSLSPGGLESKHTVLLFLFIPAVRNTDSGVYKCQSVPPNLISSVNISVVDSDEGVEQHQEVVTGEPQTETSSGLKSTCSFPVSWSAPLWYLLCKTALLLICFLSAVWKKSS